jgi:hypothetical protein
VAWLSKLPISLCGAIGGGFPLMRGELLYHRSHHFSSGMNCTGGFVGLNGMSYFTGWKDTDPGG